jgi:uncharacterized protein YjbI with pentapeptide repeats
MKHKLLIAIAVLLVVNVVLMGVSFASKRVIPAVYAQEEAKYRALTMDEYILLNLPVVSGKRYLANVQMPRANLYQVDLNMAMLAFADLEGANLVNAKLKDADLGDANLANADLEGANLANAFLVNADLSGANLTGARLAGTDLGGANLTGANLTGTGLTDAGYDNSTIWPEGFDAEASGAVLLGE